MIIKKEMFMRNIVKGFIVTLVIVTSSTNIFAAFRGVDQTAYDTFTRKPIPKEQLTQIRKNNSKIKRQEKKLNNARTEYTAAISDPTISQDKIDAQEKNIKNTLEETKQVLKDTESTGMSPAKKSLIAAAMLTGLAASIDWATGGHYTKAAFAGAQSGLSTGTSYVGQGLRYGRRGIGYVGEGLASLGVMKTLRDWWNKDPYVPVLTPEQEQYHQEQKKLIDSSEWEKRIGRTSPEDSAAIQQLYQQQESPALDNSPVVENM